MFLKFGKISANVVFKVRVNAVDISNIHCKLEYQEVAIVTS